MGAVGGIANVVTSPPRPLSRVTHCHVPSGILLGYVPSTGYIQSTRTGVEFTSLHRKMQDFIFQQEQKGYIFCVSSKTIVLYLNINYIEIKMKSRTQDSESRIQSLLSTFAILLNSHDSMR